MDTDLSPGTLGSAPAAVPSIVPADVMAAASIDGQATAVIVPGADPGQASPATAEPIDYAAEAADLVEFAAALFTPIYPSLAPIYPPAVRARISTVLTPLMRKYDVSLGRFGPELMAVVTIAPLIVPTVRAIKADRAAEQSAAPNDRSPVGSNVRSNENTIEKSTATVETRPDSPMNSFPSLNGAPATP